MYSVYVNLDPRQRKVRIHTEDCTNNRKNGTPENELHSWRDFEDLWEAIGYADGKAKAHDLSPWTDNACACGVNQRPTEPEPWEPTGPEPEGYWAKEEAERIERQRALDQAVEEAEL